MFKEQTFRVYLGIGQKLHVISMWHCTKTQLTDLILGVICGISSLCLYLSLDKRVSPAFTGFMAKSLMDTEGIEYRRISKDIEWKTIFKRRFLSLLRKPKQPRQMS